MMANIKLQFDNLVPVTMPPVQINSPHFWARIKPDFCQRKDSEPPQRAMNRLIARLLCTEATISFFPKSYKPYNPFNLVISFLSLLNAGLATRYTLLLVIEMKAMILCEVLPSFPSSQLVNLLYCLLIIIVHCGSLVEEK